MHDPTSTVDGAKTWRASILILILGCVALVTHAAWYHPFFADDSLISLRYSRRLLDGQGLTWNDGERVEGYTNLLWVLGTALVGKSGLDLVRGARVLGLASIAACLAAVVVAYRPARLRDGLPAAVGVASIALAAPMAVWAIGGLEEPLLAGLLAWAAVLCLPLLEAERVRPSAVVLPGVLLGLVCLTRADGALFTVGFCLALLVARRDRTSVALSLMLALIPLLFFAGQILFRLEYYGEWVPNTALVKVGFSPRRFVTGLGYVGYGFLTLFPLVALLGVGLGMALRGRIPSRRIVFFSVPIALWSVYVVSMGGDFLPAFRHFVPTIALMALMAAEVVRAFGTTGKTERMWPWMAGFSWLFVFLQFWSPQSAVAHTERWEWDGEVMGKMLGRAFGDRRALIAVDAAGTYPYYSGLPSVDMLGLNDHYLTRHKPADFESRPLGHALGDSAYVLDRQPDIVIFCGPYARGGDPCWPSGQELFADPRFHERYSLIYLEGRLPHRFGQPVWARREGGAVGIQRIDGRVSVPGYLLATTSGVFARPSPDGRLAADIPAFQTARWRGLAPGPGKWALTLSGEVTDLDIEVRLPSGKRQRGNATGPLELDLPAEPGGMLDLAVEAMDGPGRVTGILLERLPGVPSTTDR
jgi:hypothetical protein